MIQISMNSEFRIQVSLFESAAGSQTCFRVPVCVLSYAYRGLWKYIFAASFNKDSFVGVLYCFQCVQRRGVLLYLFNVICSVHFARLQSFNIPRLTE